MKMMKKSISHEEAEGYDDESFNDKIMKKFCVDENFIVVDCNDKLIILQCPTRVWWAKRYK